MPPRDFVEYFAVFDGFKPALKDVNLPIHEAIEKYILNDLMMLRPKMEANLSPEAIAMLTRLARGDRKIHSVYKKESISQGIGRSIYRQLFEDGIISIEKSREILPTLPPKAKRKKALRGYKAEDKIHFRDSFTRFWFTFLSNCQDPLTCKAQIEEQFEAYVGLAYEQLSLALLALHVKESQILNQGSYWDRRHEIDILVTLQDGRVIAGESKWKNRKVCKNILTSLQTKCAYASLHVDYFALFSKSGFSKELLKNRDENVWLFDIDSFERLRDD